MPALLLPVIFLKIYLLLKLNKVILLENGTEYSTRIFNHIHIHFSFYLQINIAIHIIIKENERNLI